MLLDRFRRRLPVLPMTPETLGVILFGLVIIVTTPFSIWPGGALQEFIDEYAKVVVVFVLIMNTLTTPKRLEQVMWLMLLCIGFIALRGVVDYVRGSNIVEGGRLTSAVSGIYGNPNDLAMSMVTFLPPAVVAALSRRNTGGPRLVAAIIVLLMTATIVFTK